MNKQEAHWVETLFPPKFSLTKQELLEERTSSGDEEKAIDYEKAFELVNSKISPLDVSSIKNVYERVHLMTLLEEEERKRRDAEEQRQKTSTPIEKKPVSPGAAYLRAKGGATSKEASIDVDDSCIWDEGEMAILRKVFKHTKSQNAQLKAMVDVMAEKLREVEERCRDLSALLKKRTKNLHEAQKANKRLQILCDNMEADSNKQKLRNDKLEKDIKTVENQNTELLKQLHLLQLELDNERLEKKKLELDLESQKIKYEQEQSVREGNLKLIHQEDIAYLKDKIQEYAAELDKERKEHERCKKGLQHLRNHFAALPMFNDQYSSSIVSKDQLHTLDWKPKT